MTEPKPPATPEPTQGPDAVLRRAVLYRYSNADRYAHLDARISTAGIASTRADYASGLSGNLASATPTMTMTAYTNSHLDAHRATGLNSTVGIDLGVTDRTYCQPELRRLPHLHRRQRQRTRPQQFQRLRRRHLAALDDLQQPGIRQRELYSVMQLRVFATPWRAIANAPRQRITLVWPQGSSQTCADCTFVLALAAFAYLLLETGDDR